MYERAFKSGQCPLLYMNLILYFHLKLVKNSNDCGSYRPISLLNLDNKILTRVLVNRLNKAILSIIGPNQAGFLSGHSTSDSNIRVQLLHKFQLHNYNYNTKRPNANLFLSSMYTPFLMVHRGMRQGCPFPHIVYPGHWSFNTKYSIRLLIPWNQNRPPWPSHRSIRWWPYSVSV